MKYAGVKMSIPLRSFAFNIEFMIHMDIFFLIIAVGLVCGGGFLLFEKFRNGKATGKSDAEALREDLARRMEEMHRGVAEEMHHFSSSFLQQIGNFQANMNHRLEDNTRTLNERLDRAAHSFGEVGKEMGKVRTEVGVALEEVKHSSSRILEVGKDVRSLQDILRSPKLRGGFGELLLGDMLSQMLPREFSDFCCEALFSSRIGTLRIHRHSGCARQYQWDRRSQQPYGTFRLIQENPAKLPPTQHAH